MICAIHSIIDPIKISEVAWHVARMEKGRNAYRVLVWKPEGVRPLGNPRSRWEDNVKIIWGE